MFGRGADRLTGDGDFENQAAADEDFFNRLPFDRPFRIELAPRRQADWAQSTDVHTPHIVSDRISHSQTRNRS